MSTPREALEYRDLESELHDALNMAELASQRIEDAFTGSAKVGECVYRLTDCDVNLIHFAVYHSEKLLKAVKARWDEIHHSNAAAKGGAK